MARMGRSFRRWVGLTSLLVILGGCAGTQHERSADHARYVAASEAMDAGRHEAARAAFDEIIAESPDSRIGRQALIDRAYLAFTAGDIEAAYADAERFLERHPEAAQAAYAQYLVGLAAFARWERSSGNGDGRDPAMAREAFSEFRDLVEGYPESDYLESGIERMIAIRDALATHELALARARFEAGDYEEAVARATYVAESYPESEVVADALAFKVEVHEARDNGKQADQTRQILELHFPDRAQELR